ncbi:MAG: hypothetical protein HWN67_07790 [Candidatus Helarchaeota archaeon]|nr:hypothetical protein [Candidatus Helarchaeota archaeon]
MDKKDCPIRNLCYWNFNDMCRRLGIKKHCLPTFSKFALSIECIKILEDRIKR